MNFKKSIYLIHLYATLKEKSISVGVGALKKLAEFMGIRLEQRETAMAGELEGARPISRMIDKGDG